MPNGPPNMAEVMGLRKTIEEFCQECLTPKLEPLDKKLAKEEDWAKQQEIREKREKLLADYQRETWLLNAAKRAGQIQLVTHAIKYTHGNARGTSALLEADAYIAEDALVSTASLGADAMQDVVGNAAALDVYKFLKQEYEGRTLLDRVRSNDPAMAAAMSDDVELSDALMQGLAAITGGDKSPASHTLARQVYFPLADGGYHLLAPLFPTSLVQAVYSQMRHDRFSDESKAARKARREQTGYEEHSGGYREYPDFAIMAFGGSKPQNISQLNSERHGENWLLASMPPMWRTQKLRLPLNTDSALQYVYGRRPAVKNLSKGLASFLVKVQDYNNIRIRNARSDMVDRLCDLLIQFTYDIQSLEPGWSLDDSCRLDINEQLWLDRERSAFDPEFAMLREAGDWRDYVAKEFGKWLNYQLNYHAGRLKRNRIPLQFGDDENHEWKRVSDRALKELREELNYV
jgi:CRISPR-associated protein Csy1